MLAVADGFGRIGMNFDKEAIGAGQTTRQAVRTAVRHAGPTVAAAALVLATSFAILMLSPYVAQVGFAVAAGVLISMFFSSWLYVPAVATLLGRRIWWPNQSIQPSSTVTLTHPADDRQLVRR